MASELISTSRRWPIYTGMVVSQRVWLDLPHRPIARSVGLVTTVGSDHVEVIALRAPNAGEAVAEVWRRASIVMPLETEASALIGIRPQIVSRYATKVKIPPAHEWMAYRWCVTEAEPTTISSPGVGKLGVERWAVDGRLFDLREDAEAFLDAVEKTEPKNDFILGGCRVRLFNGKTYRSSLQDGAPPVVDWICRSRPA